MEVTAILEVGAPIDLNSRRRRRLLQQSEEGAELLRMTPSSFAPAWLSYDLYARYYVKALELSLGIPAGMTANVSYGGVSTVLTGDATLTAELSYGGTLVQVLLGDPAYDGESTAYVLHAHRELRPDAPSLPSLSAEAIGGNAAVAFETMREGAFDDMATATGGDSAHSQPASHYLVTVTNPEQLKKGEEVTVRYSLVPTPDWADSLTVTWTPPAAVASLNGAESLVYEPPSDSFSVTYVANATTRLLLRSGGAEFSYAIQVDMGARLISLDDGTGGDGSNQDATDGPGDLEDDTGFGTIGAPPPSGEEERPWLLWLLVGVGALLLLLVCCVLITCSMRKKKASRGRAETRAVDEVEGASFNSMPAINTSRESVNPVYGGMQDDIDFFDKPMERVPSRQSRGVSMLDRSISMQSTKVMDNWLSVAASGSNPMFGDNNSSDFLDFGDVVEDRSAFSSGTIGAAGAPSADELVVCNNPLLSASRGRSARDERSSMILNPLAMMGGDIAAPGEDNAKLDNLMESFDAGGVMAATDTAEEMYDVAGWVQYTDDENDEFYWINASSGEIAQEMPQVVFESEMRQIENVAENLESVALELNYEHFASGTALGARDATKALLAAMESGDDMASQNAAIRADGLVRTLEEAIAAPMAASSPDSVSRLKRALTRVRSKLNPVLALAKLSTRNNVSAPAEVNISPLAIELRRRREALRRVANRRASQVMASPLVSRDTAGSASWEQNPAFG